MDGVNSDSEQLSSSLGKASKYSSKTYGSLVMHQKLSSIGKPFASYYQGVAIQLQCPHTLATRQY